MRVHLSAEEVKKIIQASLNPIYKQANVLVLGSNSSIDIVKVSQQKGLILIRGNSAYGLEHILMRHNFHSKKEHWISDPKNRVDATGRPIKKLDNPSRFSSQSIPFLEFVWIAEKIYDKKNKNDLKNHNPNVLELYEGESSKSVDGIKRKYRLLVYKDTKIIHTLFPLDNKSKKKRPKKSQFNFHRHELSCSMTSTGTDDIEMFRIPYSNFDKQVRYILIIRRSLKSKIEKHYVQVNNQKGIPLFTHLIKENEFNPELFFNEKYFNYLENVELTSFESFIGKMDKEHWPHKNEAKSK